MKFKKKSLLFTIASIFLLSAVFIMSKTYLEYNKDARDMITFSSFGDKFNYIQDDIIGNSYSDLLGINISSIEKKGNQTLLNFSKAGKIGPNVRHNTIFQNYENFIEGTYSKKHNINVTLDGFSPSFNISPYDGRFVYNSQKLTINNGRDYLKKIFIQIKANATMLVSNTTPSSDGHDYPEIHVIVKNINDAVLYDEHPQQDPDERGDFTIIFESGRQIILSFGIVAGSPPATLVVEDNLYAEIEQLELWYDTQPENIIIKSDANMSIHSEMDDVKKKTEIVLLEE